jgi:hypothetical protein
MIKLNDAGRKSCRELAKAIDAYIAKVDEDLADSLKKEGYEDTERSVEAASDMEESIAEALQNQTDEIINRIFNSADVESAKSNIDDYFESDDDTSAEIADITEDYYSSEVEQLSTAYIKQTDSSLVVNQIRERTRFWISEWSGKLADLMNLTSKNQIDSILDKAMEKGESVADVTRSIMDSGIRNEYSRARRVAVTEMLRAHSVAQQEAMVQSPACKYKKWRHTGAYKNMPRPNHVEMNGQVVEVDKPFELNGIRGGIYHPMYPRDSSLPVEEVANCHCLAQPVADEDILGMDLEARQKLQQEIIDADDREWEAQLEAENKARAGIDTEEATTDIQYMSNSVKPKYGEISTIKINNEFEVSVKKVTNSRFDMYTDIDATERDMAVKLAEKKFTKVEKHNMDANAIGAYSRSETTIYINSKYKTEKSIKSYINKNKGWFANKTTDAPYLHELGHKYHYDCIEQLANLKNLSYNSAKIIYEAALNDFLDNKNAMNGNYILENLSNYASYDYDNNKQGNKMNEVMAEWFTVRNEENPTELVSFITDNEGAWKK